MIYLFVILLGADPGGHTGIFARNVWDYPTVAACEADRTRRIELAHQPGAAQALISTCATAQDRLEYRPASWPEPGAALRGSCWPSG